MEGLRCYARVPLEGRTDMGIVSSLAYVALALASDVSPCQPGDAITAFYDGMVVTDESTGSMGACRPSFPSCWFPATIRAAADSLDVDWADGDPQSRNVPLVLAKRVALNEERSCAELSTVVSTSRSCCDKSLAAEALVSCAAGLAPSPRRGGALIVTHATPAIYDYAGFSLVPTALWCQRFGHGFVVDRRPITGERDLRATKVAISRDWMHQALAAGASWLLWLDADAAVVDFTTDSLKRVVESHAQQTTEVMITLDPVGTSNASKLFNSGTMLFRVSRWSQTFLESWWEDGRLQAGNTDQEVFERMFYDNYLGLRDVTVVLPPETLNSKSELPVGDGAGLQQPVVHLMGAAAEVRMPFFRDVWRLACRAAEHEPLELARGELARVYEHVLRNAGPSSALRLGQELVVRLRFLEAEFVLRPLAGHLSNDAPMEDDAEYNPTRGRGKVRSLLAQALLETGRPAEASSILVPQLRALRSAELATGHPQLARGWEHCATILARAFGMLGRISEAEALARHALAHADGFNGANSVLTALADVLRRRGSLAEASAVMAHTVAAAKAFFGKADSTTLTSMANLGTILYEQGRLAEAESWIRHAYRGLQNSGSGEASQVAGVLAHVLGSLPGRKDEASQLLRTPLT